MVVRRSYSREFKLGLCAEIAAGHMSKARACREHNLCPSMLDRWVGQYRVRGEDSFPNSGVRSEELLQDQRTKELEALVGRQALEIEFLKAALQKGEELVGKKRK